MLSSVAKDDDNSDSDWLRPHGLASSVLQRQQGPCTYVFAEYSLPRLLKTTENLHLVTVGFVLAAIFLFLDKAKFTNSLICLTLSVQGGYCFVLNLISLGKDLAKLKSEQQ